MAPFEVAVAKAGKKVEIAPEELTPFKSLLLLSTDHTLSPKALVSNVLPEIQDLSAGKWRRSVSQVSGPHDDPNLYAAFFTYIEERPPGWARGSTLRDVLHHVVIACRGKDKAKNLVAFFFSDNALRDKAVEKILAKQGHLGNLASIAAGTMHAAYVKGQTITLWMSGTHRRDATKVDNKVISGLDLQHALDPLGDQSFYFTAARSRVGGKIDKPIGSSPRRSRLWLGPSRDWNDFAATTRVVLDLLVEATKPVTNPLPVLASPILGAAELKKVDNAYDVAFIPPELIDPSAASHDVIEQRERLAGLLLEPSDQDGPDFTVTLSRGGDGDQRLGSADVQFTIDASGSARWAVDNEESSGEDDELFADAIGAMKHRRTWLKVWYDSGHTLADETFFAVRFRDQPFTNFEWVDLTHFDVTKEKPSAIDVDTIGTEDSLFCWVKKHWAVPGSDHPGERGWLACDDGSMEKADFLHLDNIKGKPTLSLIHVKASKSDDDDRPISVSDYEIVTSQAVKNLRWIDQGILAAQLKGRIKDKIWHDGKPANAEAFSAAVKALGSNYIRNVVILQPRVRKTAEVAARAAPPNGAAHLRLLQLDALLLGARANILGLNANMYVLGDNS